MNFKSAINTGNEGLYWLNRIRELKPTLPVIMITAYGAIDLAVQSLKQGATDFIVKPWQNEHLLQVIDGLLAKSGKQKAVQKTHETTINEMIGKSDIMKRSEKHTYELQSLM